MSKELVELLVFVLHPESVDCLANHLLGFSRYSSHAKEPWLARITLRSWRLEDYAGDWACSENEGDPILVPDKVKEALMNSKLDPAKRVAPPLSSIVISTNAFGDFTKTTIVSKIMPGSKLRYAGNKAQELWRMFVHQPQTARCLVFLLLLELLILEIEKQYRDAADYLIGILRLDVGL